MQLREQHASDPPNHSQAWQLVSVLLAATAPTAEACAPLERRKATAKSWATKICARNCMFRGESMCRGTLDVSCEWLVFPHKTAFLLYSSYAMRTAWLVQLLRDKSLIWPYLAWLHVKSYYMHPNVLETRIRPHLMNMYSWYTNLVCCTKCTNRIDVRDSIHEAKQVRWPVVSFILRAWDRSEHSIIQYTFH